MVSPSIPSIHDCTSDLKIISCLLLMKESFLCFETTKRCSLHNFSSNINNITSFIDESVLKLKQNINKIWCRELNESQLIQVLLIFCYNIHLSLNTESETVNVAFLGCYLHLFGAPLRGHKYRLLMQMGCDAMKRTSKPTNVPA